MEQRRGSASAELALIAMPLILFILSVFELGYDFYVQNALDFALSIGVRQIATGSVQSSVTSLATFRSLVFCPAVGMMLPCASIQLNVIPVSGFTSATVALPTTNGQFDPTSFTYCPGVPGQLMMAQAVYPTPSFVGALLPGGLSTYSGQTVRLIDSIAGFVNEPYTATAPKPAGC